MNLYRKKENKLVIKTIEDAKKAGTIGVYQDDVNELLLLDKGFANLKRFSGSL